MAIFDFVENFFFISLAITFALVLLLVYHFKQRISLVERKGDTMFELLTNVVKELKCVKKLNNYYESIFSSSVPEIDTCMFSAPSTASPSASTEYKIIDLSLTPITPEKASLIPVSDDSESSDEEDDDDESNTEYTSSSESDSESEDEDGVPPLIEVDNFDDLPELIDTEDFIPVENLVETLGEDVVESDLSAEVSELIHPTEEVSQDVSQPDESQSNLAATTGPTVEQKREVYRKMNITQLKTMAVAANITVDVSKMKKVELIKLLESLDE